MLTLAKDCVVPGAVQLLYVIELPLVQLHKVIELPPLCTDLAARFVNNLERGIIERLSVWMQGQEVHILQSYGDYWGIRD